MKSSLALALTAVMLAGLIVGCDQVPSDVYSQLITEQKRGCQLEQDNEVLVQQLLRQERQMETLLALGEKRLEQLYFVDGIRLGRYSGGWDLDGDGKQDGIKVFLSPHDQYGTAIKAAGSATVQLYDLAAEPNENLIAEFNWTVEELPDAWASGFMSYHYTLNCPWGDSPPGNDVVTVRVVFVDYLTGKTFCAQKACEIDLVGGSPEVAE